MHYCSDCTIARWALQALGTLDYGLLGVVGGLAAFISFFNGISQERFRYFALAIGKESKELKTGVEECRMWFTTACIIHTILPQ